MHNIIEKTKDSLDNQINEYFQTIAKNNITKKSPYYDLLKKTMTKLFYNDSISISNFSVSDNERQRPETAKPSNIKNLEFRNKSKRLNGSTMTFKQKHNSTVSNDGSVPSSPTFERKREEISDNEFLNKNVNSRKNINLTQTVWPKSKTLLSIVSKMFSDCYIDENQRGLLKEMIMDYDDNLMQILSDYEVSGDSNRLYECIIRLTK